MPLRHDPGEAQVDYGHALVKFQGKLTKAALFVMALPYSDALFVRAYGRRDRGKPIPTLFHVQAEDKRSVFAHK